MRQACVIETHGLSYRPKFLQSYRKAKTLLADSAFDDRDRGQRNLIKTIEKQKAQREERLKDLLAEDKKDDGLVFDELGVDHIYIDESHYFKNLETALGKQTCKIPDRDLESAITRRCLTLFASWFLYWF
jgi:N12 class adenine-specific DNA methylase